MASPIISKIRDVFTAWDDDGSGTISREELCIVLMHLMNRPKSDTELLMNEIDVNGDGIIEWEEFIQWVMNPSATMKTTSCGTKLQRFDFKQVLRPLFEVYDKSENDQFITFEDFESAHTIVQGSLKLFPADAGLDMHEMTETDLKAVFNIADQDKDDLISFDEFVSWQKKTMEKSGIPNWALHDAVSHLVTALRQIFHIDEKNNRGEMTDADNAVLEKSIQALSASSRQLWSKVDFTSAKGDPEETYPNHWCEPPVGLSIDRLVKKHLKEQPIKTFRSVETHADVRICIPQVPGEAGEKPRKWYAKILRTARYENSQGGLPKKDPYYYEFESLNWTLLKDPAVFYHAVETLAPDVRIFCLLKAEANMGIKIRWRGIMAALEDAVEMELISQKQFDQYKRSMLEVACTSLRAEGADADLENMDQCLVQGAERFLEQRLEMRPRMVMSVLADLKIVAMSPVWQEFWKDEEEE